jgi:hypothetical protein
VEFKRSDLDADSKVQAAEQSKRAVKPEQAAAAIEPASNKKPRPE